MKSKKPKPPTLSDLLQRSRLPGDSAPEKDEPQPEHHTRVEMSTSRLRRLDTNDVDRIDNVDTVDNVDDSVDQPTGAPFERASRKAWDRPGYDQLNFKFPRQLVRRFDLWCHQNKVTKTEAIMRALSLLMDGVSTSSTSSTSSTLSTSVLIDDFKIDDDNIVVVFSELTGNKWKATRDAPVLKELRDAGRTTSQIECGIALSVFRCSDPSGVVSLRYCVGAIEEVAENPAKDLQQYVDHIKTRIAKDKKRKTQPKPGGT